MSLETRAGEKRRLPFGRSAGKSRLYLRGRSDEAIAYITVSIFGNESHAGYAELTAEITRIFSEVLGVPPANVYVKYDDISVCGAGGMCFDRNLF